MPKAIPPHQEIKEAYDRINAVLQPLTIGDGGNHKGKGGDPQVVAARAAYQALQVLAQYARLNA